MKGDTIQSPTAGFSDIAPAEFSCSYHWGRQGSCLHLASARTMGAGTAHHYWWQEWMFRLPTRSLLIAPGAERGPWFLFPTWPPPTLQGPSLFLPGGSESPSSPLSHLKHHPCRRLRHLIISWWVWKPMIPSWSLFKSGIPSILLYSLCRKQITKS